MRAFVELRDTLGAHKALAKQFTQRCVEAQQSYLPPRFLSQRRSWSKAYIRPRRRSLWTNVSKERLLSFFLSKKAARCTAWLCDILHLVCVVAPRRWRRERLSVLVAKRNCLLYNLAQLLENDSFVLAVAPTVNQARRAPDEALVLFRPLDDLRIPRAFVHDCAAGSHGWLIRHDAGRPVRTS